MSLRGLYTLLLALLLTLTSATVASAASDSDRANPFSYTFNTLAFGTEQYPSRTTQNPDNAFLNLSRYSTELDLRSDFYWDQPGVSALFKPRFTSNYQWWEDGITRGTDYGRSRAFVNEWRVQVNPTEKAFFSFGKEKLLWGPSFIASPSNILFKDTEKLNPKSEVEGKYIAKAIYVPNDSVTVNLITETENQKNGLGETLKSAQAIKTDVIGSDYQVSVIGFYRERDRFRFGSFGQWTASDAMLLYYDGIVSPGTDALYPVTDAASPFGGSFEKKYDNSDKLFLTATAGGSYTFLAGPTLNLEFLYNGQGYNNREAREYYQIRSNAAAHYFDASQLSGLSRMTLNETFNTGLPFLRRYYLMSQVQVREIANVLDLYVRYTHGIEEHAGQASTIAEWRITDHASLFNINTVSTGGRDTEFRSVIDRSSMLGVEVRF